MKTNSKANRVIKEAVLCKIFKCMPDQLDEVDWDKIEYFEIVYSHLAKESPLSMLM